MAAFATKLQAEFNKPILAHLGFDLAGAYNVAQRASDLASMPLSALQESLWPRLYAQQNPIRQLCRTGLVLLTLALGCRSEEHTSELQSLMRISYAVFCLKKKKMNNNALHVS